MRTLMRERRHDRLVTLKPASLYDIVRRLSDAGLIEEQETVRDTRRPERTVYAITAAGREALQQWVESALRDPRRTSEFPAALSFMYALPRAAAINALRSRAADLSDTINATEAGLEQARADGVPEIFLSEERYSQSLRRAEHRWLAQFIRQLDSGELVWPKSAAARVGER